ncbi:MAG: ABC transporter substrate-binding protein [Eubacteriales bacterium]|nr:ABC transporter substrate-binding protein [Eubacteriales bacterium]
MKHHWKKAALLLAAALSLTACGGKTNTEETTAQNTETSAAASSEASGQTETADTESSAGSQESAAADGTHEVTDMGGNKVMVPDKIERVVIDQIPILSTYMAYFEGSAPYIVGYCGSFKDTISETVLKNIAPELMESSETVYAQSDLNIEEIIKLQPDVILYNANNAEHAEILKSSGIPAIGFATVGADTPADPTQRYQQWLNLLEDVFNEPGKMDSFFEKGDAIMADVEGRIAEIPEEERPSAMILFKLIDGVPQVAGKGVFGDFWLQHLGVKNVAQEAQGFAQVSFEQIYSWNPQVLFLNGPGLLNLTEKDVLDNTVEGVDFSTIQAVKDKRVYDTTLGMWNWFTPNPDAPLVLAWLACNTYPEAFADYPLEETIRSYYKDFYHYDITDDELEGMLHL